MVEIKVLCFRWLSSFFKLVHRGFQDLLKVRSSSVFMFCGCISNSIGSLMNRPMYPVLAERSLVSCSIIIWSWLMMCSATAYLSICARRICPLCSFILIWIGRPCRIHMGPCIHPAFLIPKNP